MFGHLWYFELPLCNVHRSFGVFQAWQVKTILSGPFFFVCVVADVFGQDEEKHYWQICKCCSSTRDKKLFEQKALMASHPATC